MITFTQYSSKEISEHDKKLIDDLKDELFNKMNFSDRARQSFNTILYCLGKYDGDEAYTKCRYSYRNILEYDKTKPEFTKMLGIIKLCKYYTPFTKNLDRAFSDIQNGLL